MNSQEIKEQLNEIEHIKKVRELAGKVKDLKAAMFITRSHDGDIHSRPMQTLQIKDDGVIWFMTAKDSSTAKEIEENPIINLSYTDPGNNVFVSVNGVASLTTDKLKIEELWSDMFRAYFPGGKDDPNITLIRVDPSRAEYWDAPDSIVSQLITVAKATLAGNPYKVSENRKVEL
jgi:general stress protein 26